MAVSKSPFSQGNGSNPAPYNPMSLSQEEKKSNTLFGTLDALKAAGAVKTAGTPKMKSSLNAEKHKLDSAYRGALAKISSSGLSDSEKKRASKKLEDIYTTGQSKVEVSNNPLTMLKKGIGGIFGAAGAVFEAGSTVSRYTQSGIKELADIVMYDPNAQGVDRMDASWADLKKQAQKDSGFKLLPKTGVKWVDSVIDFGVDQVFDPLNYIGVGEIKWAGKAGRFALLSKLGTKEMVATYPELVGKLDDIARYGMSAVPKSVRDAEGLSFGLRFAGAQLPKTEAAARLISGRKGVGTFTRNFVSDKGVALTNKLEWAGKFTPASRINLRIAEIGMNKGLPDAVVRQHIAEYTAAKYAKGFKSQAYNQATNKVKDLVDEVRKAGKMEEVALLADDAAALAVEPDAQLRSWAQRYRNWQDIVLDEVNAVRSRFNVEFGADMKLINSIDDYGIHHTMTQKAFEFAYGAKGRATGFFKDADLTPMELGGNTGAAMFRRYKQGEQFMGETLDPANGGIIKQINEIFKRKTGNDFNFFETDLASVADSYAYSMSAKRGQEAYVRRMLDFGDDVAKVINKKMVPDKDLVAELTAAHGALRQVHADLKRVVNKGRAVATDKTKEVIQFAKAAIDLKDAEAATIGKQIGNVTAQLDNIELSLLAAAERAALKSGEARGAFDSIWGKMIDEVRQLRANIEANRISEVAAHDALRDVYKKMRPDARRIPSSPSRLLDIIQQNEGIGDWTQVRELEKRLKGVQSQLAESADLDPNDLNELLDIEQELLKRIDGFRQLGEVKMQASYADDGLLYGNMGDLVERPFDPNLDPTARVISTKPMSGRGYMTTDEHAALWEAQMMDPNSVAVHAIPETDVIDMRQPEHFFDFWNPDNGVGEAADYALRRAGVDGDGIFKEMWDSVMDGKELDPMFEQIHPELSNLLIMAGSVHANEFATGIVPDDFNIQTFETLKDLFTEIAGAAQLEQSDIVGQQMFDDFMRAMVQEGAGNTGRPILVPSGVIYGSDNPMAMDAFSLVLPDEYNYASAYGQQTITDDMIDGLDSPVFMTADSEFIMSIAGDDYHTADLMANEMLTAVGEAGQQLQSDLAERGVLTSEARTIGGKIGGIKSAGSRRVRAAEKAYADFEASGMVEFTLRGKKVRMPRDKAVVELARSEAKVTRAIEQLDEKLSRVTAREIDPVLKRKAKAEDRLATLVNQRQVIETWNAQTGDALRAEIDVLKTAVMTDMPSGWAGTESRRWADGITKAIDNIKVLDGSPVKDAWERVITQLGADEAQLSMLELTELPAAWDALKMAESGFFGGRMVDDIEKGWKALEGTGIQLPEEFHAIIQPNVSKLAKVAERKDYFKAYKTYNQLFKIYATMTPGFVVRNAMSATFMNKVAGVETNAIMDGTKAALYYKIHGPNNWLDALNITDRAERELYETAMRAVIATGRISSDLTSPVLKGGWAHKLADNKATRALGNANDLVENSVRLPMALDTLRKGNNYDDAIYRISRFHFDYSDLSSFDETMKNFIPFWVWTSRNLPLQMTQQFMRPRYYNMYADVQDRNPVAADVMLPTWARTNGAMGLGGSRFLMADMPMGRLQQTAEGFVSPAKLLGQANPLVKLPAEILSSKQLATGIPFTDKYDKAKGFDRLIAGLGAITGAEGLGRTENGQLMVNPKASYALGNLLPSLATLQRLSGGATGGKNTYQERQLSSILNAAGIPVRDFGPQQQRGETISRQFTIADLMKEIARK